MMIAIDGPAGAGKSEISRGLAAKLGFAYLDTGAMYRTVALYMLRNGIDPQDEQTVSAHCGEADVRVAYRDGAQRTMLGGEDVSDLIRTGEVSAQELIAQSKEPVRQFGERVRKYLLYTD